MVISPTIPFGHIAKHIYMIFNKNVSAGHAVTQFFKTIFFKGNEVGQLKAQIKVIGFPNKSPGQYIAH